MYKSKKLVQSKMSKTLVSLILVVAMSFSFMGWNTGIATAQGAGLTIQKEVISNGRDLPSDRQYVFELILEQQTYTVIFNANGGTGSHVESDLPSDSSYEIQDPSVIGISRLGYTFTNWNTQADGSGTAYAPGDTITITGNLSLYAQWSAVLYSVTYNANEGTGSHVDSGLPVYSSYAIQDPSAIGIGRPLPYTFANWNTQPDGSGTAYAPGYIITITGNLNLYAQWSLTSYTVAFNANGGVPTPSQQTVAAGGTVLQPANPNRAGYLFSGWYDSPTFTGNAWNFASNLVNGDMILYAKWDVQTLAYSVHYFAGSLSPQDLLAVETMAPVQPGTVITLTQTQLDLHKPFDYDPGIQVGGPVAITVDGQIINVLYLPVDPGFVAYPIPQQTLNALTGGGASIEETSQGTYQILLKAGQAITIPDLPHGVTFRVTERGYTDDGGRTIVPFEGDTAISGTSGLSIDNDALSASGMIVDSINVIFANTYTAPISGLAPTGDNSLHTQISLIALMASMGLCLVASYMGIRKKAGTKDS